MAKTYTPAEQAAINQKFPNLTWIGGVPYTSAPEDTTGDPTSPNPQYQPQTPSDQLTPAELETTTPWPFIAAMLAAPAIADAGSTALGFGATNAAPAAPAAAPAPAFSAPVIPSLAGATLPGTAVTLSGAPLATSAATTGAAVAGTTAAKTAAPAAKSFWERLIEPKTLAQAGTVLGKAADAMTNNREAADRFNLSAQQVNEILAQNRESSDRDWVQTADADTNSAWKNAVRAAIAQNLQPSHIDVSQFKTSVPDLQGSGTNLASIRDSLAPSTSALQNAALRRLMNPPSAPDRDPLTPITAQPPSIWERLAGPSGLALSILGNAYGGNK